jgi:predicted nucleic acid-binding protein
LGVKLLIDTNIVIYYLQQLLPGNVEDYLDSLFNKYPSEISFITEIELLCWNTDNTSDLLMIEQFINDIGVIELDTMTKKLTVNIRRIHKIKLPDAIIAATAIAKEMTLITRNEKDFRKINNLKVINPFEMV